MLKKGLYLAVVSILLSGIWIISGCGHRPHGDRAEWMTEKIVSELELDEAQKKQLNSFRDELKEKRQELRNSRSTIEEELIAQLRNEKIDQEHLKEVIAKEEVKLNEMVSTFVTQLAAFHDSLTPEQRTKLAEMLKKWDNHRQKHHDRKTDHYTDH